MVGIFCTNPVTVCDHAGFVEFFFGNSFQEYLRKTDPATIVKDREELFVYEDISHQGGPLSACLHEVGDPRLVGLVSFVFTL